jgi:MFS family permease
MSQFDNYEDERRPMISKGGRSSSPERNEGATADGAAVEFVSPPTCLGKLCDPRTLAHRLFILIFMAFISFGSYFCYDNPGAMQEVFMQEMSLTNTEYMALYSWYSWPNVIVCFFGGFLIDRVFGIRLGTIVFSSILTLGQVVFASGAFFNSYWILVAGRFLFGIGGESLAVAGNNYVVKWFAGRELNMVFGLQLSVSRLGSVFNMNSMQSVFDWTNDRLTPGYVALGAALLIACGVCVYSLFCALMMAFFDKRADRILNRAPPVSATELETILLSIELLTLLPCSSRRRDRR